MGEAVSLRGVWKRYGHRDVLRGIDLGVSEGESLAVFGPNGAGKSTLLRIVARRIRPSRGEVAVFGGRDRRTRERVGVVLHQSFLRSDLSVEENLRFYADLHGVRGRSRVEDVMRRVGLMNHRRHPVRALSEGLERRASLGRALLPDPDLLILDEPFAGLDTSGADLVLGIIEEYRGSGRTVLMVTHRIDLGCRVAHRAIVLEGGRLARTLEASKGMDPETVRRAARPEGERQGGGAG